VGIVLDTGALIAFERGDRRVAALVEATRRRKDRLVTSSGCVAQAWRGGTRQALLARLLVGLSEQPLDPRQSRQVGVLCAAAATNDVVDAHVVLLAHDRDGVLTSDADDLDRLIRAAGSAARIISC
jgi:hypothetical protein